MKTFVFIAVCLFSCVTTSYAQLTNEDLPDRTGYKVIGNATLHGAFKTAEMIDTNIFLENTDRMVDSVTILSPSVGIEIPSHNSSFSADYQADIYEYAVNHEQDYVDQRIRGLAEFVFADFYKATINEIYRIFTDRASTENSIRLKEKVNDIRAGISANYNRLNLDAGYTNRIELYDSTEPFLGTLTYNDKARDVNIVDTTVSYRFWPKTSALLENDLGFIHYFNSSEVPGSYYDEALFGFKGEWFAKGNINFKAGFKFQEYDQSDMIADKNYIGPVMRGGFDYTPTPDNTLVFEFDREIYESLYATNNYYIANLFGFNWQHAFTPKIYSNVFASYGLHLYPSETTENGETAKRYDNYYQAGVSLRYNVRKWISLEAKYEYVNRISRFDIFDYLDHQMTVSGTIGF